MNGHHALLFALQTQGFALIPADQQVGSIDTLSPSWQAFAGSWDDLGVDTHMADLGRYRRRRHAVFRSAAGQLWQREPDQAHFQTLNYNPLNGGVERWFEPVLPSVAENRVLRDLLACGRQVFDARMGQARNWRVEVHQFRIEARPDAPGLPTPEGAHRDGVDFVMVVMIRRQNIRSGTTQIFSAAGALLGEFTLSAPVDMAWVDDHRVWHGVTPVEPEDPTQAAWRDVLVLTWVAQ